MSAARVFAIAGRLIRQLLRDRRATFLILFVPILIMTLLTVLLRTEDQPPKLAISASGTVSLFLNSLEDMLENPEDPSLAFELVKLSEGITPSEAIRQGNVDAVLCFPDRFLEQRASGKRSALKLTIHGADPMRTADIFSRLKKAVPSALSDMPTFLPPDCAPHCADTIPSAPPDIELVKLYGRQVREMMDFYTPVLPPFFVFFFVFLLSGLTFLRERVSGTAERILASPLRRTELVCGYVLGFLPAALVQAALIIGFARYALGGPWGGWTVIVAVLLMTLVAECMGVFVSAFARSEFQVIQFIPIVILPQVLLCGMIWPITTMPGWLKVFAYAMPLTYAVQAIRDTAIREAAFAGALPELAVLALFVVAGLVLASASVRRVI